MQGKIELVVDPIDEKIEELSAVAAAWQKNRDRDRPSPSLRAAIIMVAEDLLGTVEFEKQRHAVDRAEPSPMEAPSSEERKIEVFQREVATLINRLSLENLSDTPDFILAEHLTDCLYQHSRIINKRENWYGRPSK